MAKLNMVKALKEKGYGADLQYAEDDIPNQLSQVENMVSASGGTMTIGEIPFTPRAKRVLLAGISIGAINAAIIAGNDPATRVDRLKEFEATTVVADMPALRRALKDRLDWLSTSSS